MPELPPARLHLRDARDQLAVAGAHVRRGARRVSGIVRLTWVSVLTSFALAYSLSRMIGWVAPSRPPAELRLDFELEVVEVPSQTGSGTIRTLRLKRKPPAAPIAPAAPAAHSGRD